MKIKILIMLTIATACNKIAPKQSPNLNVTVQNECSCNVKIFKATDSTQIASDRYDCNYSNIVRFKVEAGDYIIKAENQYQTKAQLFTKSNYEQNLIISF